MRWTSLVVIKLMVGWSLLAQAALAATTTTATLSADEIHDTQTAAIRLEASSDAANIDLSTLSATQLPGVNECGKEYVPDAITESGHKIKMLGTALMYMGPTSGKAVLGHLGERYEFCRDNQYYDVLYDYAPFNSSLWDDTFDGTYGVPRASFTDAQKKNVFESLFVLVNFNPPAYYQERQVVENASIYEAWFNLSGATMYKMMVSNVSRYDDQVSNLRNHLPLPAYKIPSDDCVTPVVNDFNLINPKFIGKYNPARLTPGFFYNYVKNKNVDRIVLYPSQRQYRLLLMKSEGKSTAFQWFLPANSVSGQYLDSWALVFPGFQSGLLRFMIISPIEGAANLLAATAEAAFGIITTPLSLLGWITHNKQLESGEFGLHRFERGISDMIASTLEVFSLQLRYPQSTAWTEEEKTFIQNFAQHSVLLHYLNTKYDNTPIVVDMKPLPLN